MITLLVMTDGRRDCLDRTLASAADRLLGQITRRVIHDDSGDPAHLDWLRRTYPAFEVITHPAGRRGFAGAIQRAWAFLLRDEAPFVFHLEDDFVFERTVDLQEMAVLLAERPHLAQIALRRQPWNEAEIAAGGVVETDPDAYVDCTNGVVDWLEHRKFFTTNPSLYRRDLMKRGWPSGAQSEGIFSLDLFDDPAVRCAYWGRRTDAPWVTHIGHERTGTGY